MKETAGVSDRLLRGYRPKAMTVIPNAFPLARPRPILPCLQSLSPAFESKPRKCRGASRCIPCPTRRSPRRAGVPAQHHRESQDSAVHRQHVRVFVPIPRPAAAGLVCRGHRVLSTIFQSSPPGARSPLRGRHDVISASVSRSRPSSARNGLPGTRPRSRLERRQETPSRAWRDARPHRTPG